MWGHLGSLSWNLVSAARGRPFTRDGWSSRFEFASRFDAVAESDDVSASDNDIIIIICDIYIYYVSIKYITLKTFKFVTL